MSTTTEIAHTATTVGIGSMVEGVNLANITEDEAQELAALVAERGVLFFRDQSMTLAEQVEAGRKFGELHIHPAASETEGFPEVLLIHTDENSERTAGNAWHTDVSCDERPPGLSMLRIEVIPETGGDTLWSSMYRAYETLSEPMQRFLLTLSATHSGEKAYRGQKYARGTDHTDYPVNSHPVIRTHPISGRKALYVNSGFTKSIDGLSRRESDALLSMLYDHIAYSVESQVRFRWEPNSVAIWDNRCVQHHASWDYFPATRHGYRVTTRGEVPVQ